MEALRIFSTSWPLAVMFIVCVAGIVVLLVIRQFRRWDAEDKELRASSARDVTPVKRDPYD